MSIYIFLILSQETTAQKDSSVSLLSLLDRSQNSEGFENVVYGGTFDSGLPVIIC